MECALTFSFLDNMADAKNHPSLTDEMRPGENLAIYPNEDNYKVCEFEPNPMKDLESFHDREKSVLISAFQEAYRSKRLTPLLKYELRCLIQARRVTQGMDELTVEFLDPTVDQLSAAEQDQVERRRHQNRQAARRFRQKRKMSEETLVETVQQLQSQNQQLQMAAQLLRKEKQLLMDIVTDHLLHCPCLSQVSQETLGGASVP